MDVIEGVDKGIVDVAIENGIRYLLSRQVNGRWKGLSTLAGESDIWVTGLVLAHIQHLCTQRHAIHEAQHFLIRSRHASGGWSYSAMLPPDADSTAWCLMALHSSKEDIEISVEEAKAFMWSHYNGNGFATYSNHSGIREFIEAAIQQPIPGWVAAHPDVTAAAILADMQNEKMPNVLKWLSKQRTSTGLINAYWWRCPYYSTALMLRAMSAKQQRLPEAHAEMIAVTLLHQQIATGGFKLDAGGGHDAFTTALALESMLHLSYLVSQKAISLCAAALLQLQKQDGSWPGDYILRIPAPTVTDPTEIKDWNAAGGGGNSLIKDADGLFATAVACYVLDLWRQALTGNHHQQHTKKNNGA